MTTEARVLIVDDDASLLQFAAKYLTRLGYQVVICQGAQEAWTQFASATLSVSLVLLDVTLRDIPATELASRMLLANPNLRLLFWSGYPFDPTRIPGVTPSQVEFLLKPFTPAMLAGAVERLLAPPPAASTSA